MAYLASRPWPGNVRQLRNVIRRAAALAEGPIIGRALLESLESLEPKGLTAVPSDGEMGVVELCEELPIKPARDHWIARLERAYLQKMLDRFGEDYDAMAEHMSLHRKSVYRLLRQHGLME